jgi:hypothetical protein
MVRISVSEGNLTATAGGSLALFSTDRVEFSGKIFEAHTYAVVAADPNNALLSAYMPVTLSSGGIFAYADLPCDSAEMEAYLSGVPNRTVNIWLYDDTDDKYICYAPVVVVAAPEPAGLVRYSSVPSLPLVPEDGGLYYLSAADTTNKAPIGIYGYDTAGWKCVIAYATYDLGNWSGTTVKALIPGVDYKATITGNLTAGWGITLTRPGRVRIRAGNAGFSVANPAGVAAKVQAAGLADIAATISEWRVEYDGTTQDWDTAAIVAF